MEKFRDEMMEQTLELTNAFHQIDQQDITGETELENGEKGIGEKSSMDFVQGPNVKKPAGHVQSGLPFFNLQTTFQEESKDRPVDGEVQDYNSSQQAQNLDPGVHQMANAANAESFPQTVPVQQNWIRSHKRQLLVNPHNCPVVPRGLLRKYWRKAFGKWGLRRNSIKTISQRILLTICCKVQPGTGLVLMLEILTFHSQICAQDLHQMLNKSRYLQRLNGGLKSHLPTQVLGLMTSIFGRHWYDSILCSCSVPSTGGELCSYPTLKHRP